MEARKTFRIGWLVATVAALMVVVLLIVLAFTRRDSIGSYSTRLDATGEQVFEKEIAASIALDDEWSAYAKNLLSGGPPPDGIPPIDEPKFVSAEEVDFLTDEDVVFVVGDGDGLGIFPQQILVWHEVVNVNDVAVTYSPLTGSAIAFANVNLGTSGLLLNSNSVYYDRETKSLWPQLLLRSIAGSRRGQSLETAPLVWMTWAEAKQMYPDAPVLSRETGFEKSYGFDPYGSYHATDTYYQTGAPFFPLMNEDDRLSDTEVVFGYFENGVPMAMQKSAVVSSRATSEPIPVPPSAIEAMWFAWAAFYPETELIESLPENTEPALE